MVGIYAKGEATELDIEALTESQAQNLCELLNRRFKWFVPMLSLEDIVVSVRLKNALQRAKRTRLIDIAETTDAEWGRTKQMGRTSYEELRRVVRPYGIELAEWKSARNGKLAIQAT